MSYRDYMDKPYHLCGCIHVDTEEEALLIQRILRQALSVGGFSVKHVDEKTDGSETTTTVSP